MRINEDFEDITFWAANTKPAEDTIHDNFDMMTNKMSNTEKKAFQLGVDTAFSIMNHLLTDGIDGESITFYNPDVEITTEFSTDEVIEWLNSKR